jgi:hypothetical protein
MSGPLEVVVEEARTCRSTSLPQPFVVASG